MAKIIFINAFETSYIGTRMLAGYLQKLGYQTHNILLGTGNYLAIEKPLENHEGYQAYSEGILQVNKATKFKISDNDLRHLGDVIVAEKPDIIGFSARSTNNWLISVIMPILKKSAPDALLVAGGFGPTLEPDLYLDGGFDCVARCDGEDTIAELAECVEKEKLGQPCPEKLHIKNTVWKIDGKTIVNQLRPQEKELSKYGEPLHGHAHFSFINNGELQRYFDPEINNTSYLTYFGRGCIGHCTYCSGGQWSSLYKNDDAKYYKRRNRRVPEVIEELKKLQENVNHIWFVDEYFALSSSETLKFCELYKKYINKTFFTYINYDYMLEHKNIFYALVDSGLIGTGVGFQTGSEQFARECYHRNLSNEHLLNFTQLCFDTNLLTGIHLIGGNCYETEEVFQETIDLVRRLPYSLEDPWRIPLQNIRLRPHPQSPITILSPKVVSDPMSAKEWYYRAVLLELARITDKSEFDELAKDCRYREAPENLNKFFLKLLKEKQRLHFRKVIEDTADKRIIFYGMGNLYEENRKFFKDLSPEAIIVDSPYKTPATFDGIKVYNSQDFLSAHKNEDITYFTFIKQSYKPRIKLNFFNGVENKNIHSVTSILTEKAI